jgi:DNA-binding response OmpR family regulator
MRDIVLVHSDQKLSDIYARRLGLNFRIHPAFDGISGLRLIKATRPHMLITQHELPWLSGLGLLKYVRKHPVMAPMPVIILSHKPAEPEALKWGANEWIRVKDMTLDQVVDRVMKHLVDNKIIK